MKSIVAGSMGAMCSRLVSQPLDGMKVRMQVYPTKYKSMIGTLKMIYAEGGIRSMWKGHTLAQVSGMAQGGVQFLLYDQLDYSLRKTQLQMSPNLKSFVCGFLTGTLGLVIIGPIELTKTRFIAREGKQNVWKIASNIFASEGIRGLYRGTLISAVQIGPLLGSRFMVYNFLCTTALQLTDDEEVKHKNQLPATVLLFAGGGSGVISNGLTYPIDVIKRRIQVHGEDGGMVSCERIVQCVRKIMREEGPRGFYKGISPSILRSCVTTSLTFSAYVKIRAALNYMDGTFT